MLLLLASLVISCSTEPGPLETPSTAEQLAPAPVPQETTGRLEASANDEYFDPNTISRAVFLSTKAEITDFINDLNKIIRNRNYDAWRNHLADSYFRDISSRTFLDEKTEELYKRDQIVAQNMGKDPNLVQKRPLKTVRDYFDYVVVPSRANDRLDDIGFISKTRVRAYTVDEKRGQRLVLYDLASINNKWMIVN